jgi:hypothetical protein
MRLNQTLAAILLCATTLVLPSAVAPVAAQQKARAKTQAPAPLTEITKEKIETIVNELEQAAKKKEFAAIVPYLAPDFKYKLDAANRPTRHATRAQYVEMIRLSISVTLDYTYLRKSLSIEVAPDGQSATAHTEAFEMLTLAQGTVAGGSTSHMTFKIYKGRILISAMAGTLDYVV